MASNSMDKYDSQNLRNIEFVQRYIDRVYVTAIREAVRLGLSFGEITADRLFSFDDYPKTHKQVEALLSRLKSSVESVVLNGIEASWTLSNNKNNELSRRVFGDNVDRLTPEQERRYFSTNDDARKAFEQRRIAGLNLSDRVWRYTDQFKSEIEMGLDIGIRNGRSAEELSRDLRDYLRHPDKLFRRVRDKHGQLVLSRRAKAFHPGQGVYRSSYKNARRLAATETNIAYRTSDHLRWQQMDFVVGIEIKLSNNHTLNGVEFHDICDTLAGKYPKDFKFTGWHPHCRCHAVSILKTDEEIAEDTRRILEGKPLDGRSVNRVDDVPQAFKDWLEDNESRAAHSFSVPYFLTDNQKYLPKGYTGLYATKIPYDTAEEYAAAMKYNKKHERLSDAQRANIAELNALLPVVRGKIMNFTEADSGRANPLFETENALAIGYRTNCQTCTVAYELRRRGFNVEATPNPVLKGYKKYTSFSRFCVSRNVDWRDRFLTADGKRADYEWSEGIKDTGLARLKFIEDKTVAQGRYEVYCAWNGGGAHVYIVERQKDGDLLWFDPQSGRRGNWIDFNDDYIDRMKSNRIGVMRIDDKLINSVFSSRFKKSGD